MRETSLGGRKEKRVAATRFRFYQGVSVFFYVVFFQGFLLMAPPLVCVCVYDATYLQVEKFVFFPICLVQHLYLDFFKKSKINVELMRKINDFKNDTLKFEHVKKTFKI